MERIVTPEILDSLPPEAPAARRSRADLRLINLLMGNARTLRKCIGGVLPIRSDTPCRVLEAGAGDGSLAVQIWGRLPIPPRGSRLILLDQLPVVEDSATLTLDRLGWSIDCPIGDVRSWIQDCGADSLDLLYANLFVHHFNPTELSTLLAFIALRTRALVLLEPRRSMAALLGARLLGGLGCNRVTRHDAIRSVEAGFRGTEISNLWPDRDRWVLSESAAGFFGHCFIARRLRIP